MLETSHYGFACRHRQREVLTWLEDRGPVSQQDLAEYSKATACDASHHLSWASLRGLIAQSGNQHQVTLNEVGADWLLEYGRPSSDWRALSGTSGPALRDWQVAALTAWAEHGRHGVVQAVTGTGKSRVGIEAIREALLHDYSVVVVVPTVDLVEQWIRALAAHGVKDIGGTGAKFSQHAVVVSTVQSLYEDPPTRADGKVLIVADECHRYGAGQWRRVLHPTYRRRLGLTATFERNDDGIQELMEYFGGAPVYDIGFKQAIAEGVVAHYDVKLSGVDLAPSERADYDEADEIVRDTRMKLLSANFPSEPFGEFLHAVQEAAEDDDDPTIADIARSYLKAFSRRIDVMTGARAKMHAVAQLAPTVESSHGALLFTRRVDTAEEIADVLRERGVPAEAVHSGLSRRIRDERLSYLRVGRLKALVAPTVLDEGIDVPSIDLAVVVGGSKSRRQMIQRMGRVLRLKSDGGKATFIVVYARNTVEDLTKGSAVEGCLDLIVEAADSVAQLSEPQLGANRGEQSARVRSTKAPPSQVSRPVLAAAQDGVSDRFSALDAKALRMTQRALDSYRRRHGGGEPEAESMLRRILSEMQQDSMTVVQHLPAPNLFEARNRGFCVLVGLDRFSDYKTLHPGRATWVTVMHAATPPQSDTRGQKMAAGDISQRGEPLRASPKERAKPTPAPPSDQRVSAGPVPTSTQQPGERSTPRGDDLISQLERLAELRRSGLLTIEEFSAAKAKLLF